MHRIALIGAGSMGALHARVLSASRRAKLSRIIDPNPTIGRALAEDHETQWTPSIDTLSDVDAVVIASPTETHYELSMACIRAGLPILVEKPLCDSLAECTKVLGAASAADVPILCGLLERYNPAVLTVRSLVTDPVQLTARRHGPYAPRIKTGVAWDLLIHDVDLAIQFFGAEPVRTIADTGQFHPDSQPGAEDAVEAVLSFAPGLASVSASRIGQRKVRTLAITELDRLIEIDLLRRDVAIYRHVSHDAEVGDWRGYRQQTVLEIPELSTAREPLATQLDRFLDILDGTVDADAERDSILPAHRVVDGLLAGERNPNRVL
ncbi:putative dehydrogenase [Tamaricihabitans halophyticus]|uniref:Putative dehydrogenase n=1 Tax=Tamaricihabitans halophyticus TaxID=1262583 RepID=A0A4R2RCB2_9PSEU|nr:Gfo/Idh/MocA family oxidoreductase [Tamaricihabitans halophyticus]TCP57065.1 putative dehydrogenase [Tamaricihabitans halophyticus]